jgi:hypothetical protein
MDPVLLPSASYYVSVDGPVLRTAMARIEEQFRDLLENGTQAEGLPDGLYAAGQHLNPYSMNQRGLYGTAAALLVLGRSQASTQRITLTEGLIKYISERPALEPQLLTNGADVHDLYGRLARDMQITFKTTDLLYALSAAPAAVKGQETLLQELKARLTASRRETGGWAVEHDPARDRDALATASAVRALCAAGFPVDPVDLGLIRDDGEDPKVSKYVRSLCVLVLAEVTEGRQDSVRLWRELYGSLRAELRHRAESNYEFRIGHAIQYVRVPWQLYLIAGACWCRPSSIVFARDLRTTLLDCIKAVGSSEGYVYSAVGQTKSTRTYGIAMDTLWRVQTRLASSRYVARLSGAANTGSRILNSRALSGVVLAGAGALAGYAVVAWLLVSPAAGGSWSELAGARCSG